MVIKSPGKKNIDDNNDIRTSIIRSDKVPSHSTLTEDSNTLPLSLKGKQFVLKKKLLI